MKISLGVRLKILIHSSASIKSDGVMKKTNVACGIRTHFRLWRRNFRRRRGKRDYVYVKIHCVCGREIINGVSAVTQPAAQMYFGGGQLRVIYSPAASAKEPFI